MLCAYSRYNIHKKHCHCPKIAILLGCFRDKIWHVFPKLSWWPLLCSAWATVKHTPRVDPGVAFLGQRLAAVQIRWMVNRRADWLDETGGICYKFSQLENVHAKVAWKHRLRQNGLCVLNAIQGNRNFAFWFWGYNCAWYDLPPQLSTSQSMYKTSLITWSLSSQVTFWLIYRLVMCISQIALQIASKMRLECTKKNYVKIQNCAEIRQLQDYWNKVFECLQVSHFKHPAPDLTRPLQSARTDLI